MPQAFKILTTIINNSVNNIIKYHEREWPVILSRKKYFDLSLETLESKWITSKLFRYEKLETIGHGMQGENLE